MKTHLHVNNFETYAPTNNYRTIENAQKYNKIKGIHLNRNYKTEKLTQIAPKKIIL